MREQLEHQANDECPCGPVTEPVELEDGEIGWLVVHRSGSVAS
jgi:hypothetical protein